MQTKTAEIIPTYRLKIERDDIPPNPRTDYDNFGKIVCWHSRHSLGDEHKFEDTSDFLKELVRKTLSADDVIDYVKKGGCKSVKFQYDRSAREWVLSSNNNVFDKWFTEYTFFPKTLKGSDMVKECILECLPDNALKELADRNNIILPVYLYDHSGITISCSHTYPYNDRWDAGQVGWIYASYDDIEKTYGAVNAENIETAKQVLVGEISTYDDYLRGDAYGYIIEKDGVEVENCWGYLGDLREMIAEMKSSAGKEYQHLFDHVDYCCMAYSTAEAVKPSIRKQLDTLKAQTKPTIPQEQSKTHFAPEI